MERRSNEISPEESVGADSLSLSYYPYYPLHTADRQGCHLPLSSLHMRYVQYFKAMPLQYGIYVFFFFFSWFYEQIAKPKFTTNIFKFTVLWSDISMEPGNTA